jgi:hypothetical protein
MAATAKGGPICFAFDRQPAGSALAAGHVIPMGDIGRAQWLAPARPGDRALRLELDGAVVRVALDLAPPPAAGGERPLLQAVNDHPPGTGPSQPRVSLEPLLAGGQDEPGQRLRIASGTGIRSLTLAAAAPPPLRICVER